MNTNMADRELEKQRLHIIIILQNASCGHNNGRGIASIASPSDRVFN